ncbi:MAG: hypothetical protein ABIU58_06020 [Ramlibacter sp.]
MNNATTSARLVGFHPGQASIDASDHVETIGATHYCPTSLLAAFILLMAGHGHCVNSSMMLGDREYALWQLAGAHALGDAELREVAVRLFGYFDYTRAPVPVGLHA